MASRALTAKSGVPKKMTLTTLTIPLYFKTVTQLQRRSIFFWILCIIVSVFFYFWFDSIWFYNSFIVWISIMLEDCYILFTLEFNSAIYFMRTFIFDCISTFYDSSFCILIFFSFNYCIFLLYYWSVVSISFSVYFIYSYDKCNFNMKIFFIILSYSSWILILASLVLFNFLIAFFSNLNFTNLDDY
jgi:type III secretory pathway component EscS